MALTQVDQGLLGTYAQYTGFKNRIINGAMMIDQRNAGASVTPANSGYALDRWQIQQSGGGAYTVQQSTNAPAGFTNSLLCTVTTNDTSLGTSDYYFVNQNIEGFNSADLAWGSADAKTVTVSFWVKSSLTGTFGGSLVNNGYNRSYPFSYTISAANTWEQKSVTITGDITGTWLTNNGIGIRVVFALGLGSNYVGTAGAWAASEKYTSTGAVSVIGTTSATWQVTGVQLEKGSTATSFDYRPYGTELALCQRYAVIHYGGTYGAINSLSSVFALSIALPVTMRAQPTFSTNISDSNFVVAAPSSTQWTLYQQNSGYSSYTGSINTISMNPTTSTQNWVQIGTYSCTLGAATAFQLGSSRYFSFIAEL